MRFLHLVILFLLTACSPQSGTLSTPESGLMGQFTEQVVISDHPHHVLMGHLVHVTRGAAQTRALIIGQRRDGVHRLRMYEAWSHGVELPFSATHRRLDGCTHGHCRNMSIGMIFLSDALFLRAQTHGFDARLLGRSATINIHVPATLFQTLQE